MDLVSLLYPTVASIGLVQVLGYLWYGPYLFGDRWLAAMKASNDKFKPQQDLMVVLYTSTAWIVSAIMFSLLRSMTDFSELTDLVKLALAAFLGFSVPPEVFGVLFEDRSREVCIISLAYLLVSYLLMATSHWLL